MMKRLPTPLLGAITGLLLFGNLIGAIVPFFAVTLAKFALPLPGWHERCSQTLVRIAERWIDGNNRILEGTQPIRWDIRGLAGLSPQRWYLIVSNHISTVDILVLQRVFNRRIPFIRFFIKRELFWVPLLGPAWWALDFPFMQRYSPEKLARRPELRGRDLETTRRAGLRFRKHPATLLNFAEGTRLTPAKQAAQESRYRHLLRPKAGGAALIMASMGERLHSLLDVTLVYPQQHPRFRDLLTGGIREVIVHVREVAIPPEFLRGDYAADTQLREQIQAWMRELWESKDVLIEQLTREARVPATS